MTVRPASDALDKLVARIEALRAKTVVNGCTEEEALAAAAKVAELLDRYDLSLDDVALRAAPCEERAYEPGRKKRIPLEECIGAVADFCGCRAWRERTPDGGPRYVFFGLAADVAVAHYLIELIDTAVRAELGRYKTSREYQAFRHQERHLVNASFALGMVGSIADKLTAMKAERDRAKGVTGRDLVVVKTNVVDAELAKLGVELRQSEGFVPGRMIAPDAYDAGGAAGAALSLDAATGGAAGGPPARRRR